jgi:hypothetical protein
MKPRPLYPADSRLRWIEAISTFLDSQFRVPGTNFRFGLDPILGLIPFGGSAASFAISGGLLLTMVKYGVSRKVLILMLGNLLLDATLGSIPVVGNIFDFFYKANQRNVNLLKRHYQQGKYTGSGTGILIAIALALLFMLGLVVYGTWKLITYLVEQL